MMGDLYTFRYIGNKHQFLDIIKQIILKCQDRTDSFIDVFGGSGVVALNIQKFFSHVVLNDIDENVMCVHNAFKNANWSDYRSFCNRTYIDTLDLSKKDIYYKFRDKGNKEFFFQDKNSFDKGFFLYFVSGGCINSFFRIGPNGFNQSSGLEDLSRRFSLMRWNSFKKAYAKIKLRNMDFTEIFNEFSDKPRTWFLDPPYFSTSNTYNSNFSSSQKEKFMLSIVEQLKGNVIYTDTYVEEDWKFLKEHGFHIRILRGNMQNVAVGKNGEQTTDRKEVVYYKQRHNI